MASVIDPNERDPKSEPGTEPGAAAGPQRGPGLRFWLAFWAIALTNLAAALDATSLSVALPVRWVA